MVPTHHRPAVLATMAASVVALAGCTNPTRPDEAQPMVEVQIDDTRQTTDDYVSPSTSVPARARITNDISIDTAVAVTLKNAVPSRGGQVRFGPGGSSVATLSLPADGSWESFSVRGAAGQLSSRDKDAVIEVAEDRPDGIVLARKALQVVSSVPSAGAPGVAIDVSQTRTSIDDYLTWSPLRVELALTGASGSGTLPVTVRNMSPVTAGRLAFAPESAISIPPQSTASQSSLSVSLPRDGSTVTIWVAGDCQIPATPGGTCSGISEHDKDAVLEVVDVSSGDVLGRKGMMVRIRKDAATLTEHERDRFLDAMAKLNMTLDNYQKFQDIHSTADDYAHGPPGFLAWHRVFVLQIERELQALEPAAALPYWKFDDAAPDVYHRRFMGDHFQDSIAPIATSNPLSNWDVRSSTGALLQGITRNPEFASDSAPSLRDESPTLAMGDDPADPAAPSTYARFRDMEVNPHGSAHVEGGGWDEDTFQPDGWLASVPTSVMDPIFFLLHSNADRLWAKWQFMEDRYDPSSSDSYAPQGTWQTGSDTARGHYVDDEMWPWDQESGPGRPSISTTPGTSLPQTIGRAFAPPPRPTPADVIPYDTDDVEPGGLGFGYDDVPFRP